LGARASETKPASLWSSESAGARESLATSAATSSAVGLGRVTSSGATASSSAGVVEAGSARAATSSSPLGVDASSASTPTTGCGPEAASPVAPASAGSSDSDWWSDAETSGCVTAGVAGSESVRASSDVRAPCEVMSFSADASSDSRPTSIGGGEIATDACSDSDRAATPELESSATVVVEPAADGGGRLEEVGRADGEREEGSRGGSGVAILGVGRGA